MGEDVDAVVTWVDSSCPAWQEARARYAAEERDFRFSPPNAPEAEVDLCLSLLVEHLPWLRYIWLVTMRPQVPACLSRAEFRDKVRVVHHDEIFPCAQGLPTFNCHAIEANLWRIPGLSERFVYFNDDMYVLRALPESVFFNSGRPVAWLSKAPPLRWARLHDTYHEVWHNLRELLPCTRVLHHFPHALTKSALSGAASRFSECWLRMCTERGRSSQDLPFAGAAVNLAVAEGKSVPEKLPKARLRGAIIKASTVEAMVGQGFCFLCVNRQPFDRTQSLCDAVRACFSANVVVRAPNI